MIQTRTLLLVFGAFLYVAGYLNGCACNKGRNATGPLLKPSVDTVYIPQPKDSTPLHQPTLAETKPSSLKPYKPSLPLPKDTPALGVSWVSMDAYAYLLSLYRAVEGERDSLWEKYYQANYWRDTARFPGGRVMFSGVTQENRLQSVRLAIDSFAQTVITRTVPTRIPERNKAYLGVHTLYRPWDESAVLGASLLFQHKRGMGLQVFGGLNTRGEGEYGLGATYLIKAKR